MIIMVEVYKIMLNSGFQGGSRGGRGGAGGPDPPPPEKSQKYRVSNSNTGPDPLGNQKATKPPVNVGQSSARQRNAI